MAKQLIGIGDIVRVINPQFFAQTKYEKDFRFFYDDVVLNQEHIIEKMMEVRCPNWQYDSDIHAGYRLRDHIVRGLALYELELSKKTGNVKYLDVIPIVWHKCTKFLVYDVSYVATGIYQAGDSGQDPSTGESWAEPPGLVKRKYHRILHVTPFDDGIYNEYDKLKIEAANVEFVEKKTVDTPRPKLQDYDAVDSEEFIEMFRNQPVLDQLKFSDKE